MPATTALPTIPELLEGFSDGAHTVDATTDTRVGGVTDNHAGIMALLLSRESQRDRDIFRDIYFDNAEGQKLTDMGLARTGIARTPAAFATGTVTLTRPTAAGGSGTIWKGTRIFVTNPPSAPREYVVSADYPVTTQTSIGVPVVAPKIGSGWLLNATQATASLYVADTLWDYWSVYQLVSTDGIDEETPATYRARVRETRSNARLGYEAIIEDTCLAVAGVTGVALFESFFDASNPDMGSSALYLGGTSGTMADDCAVALEAVRVAGVDLFYGDISARTVNVAATLELSEDPGLYNHGLLTTLANAAVTAYFGRLNNPYVFRQAAIESAIVNAHEAIQGVTFTTLGPTGSVVMADPTIVVDSGTGWAWNPMIYKHTLGTQAYTFTGPA